MPARRSHRVLVLALVASIAVHLAVSLWPEEIDTTPDALPLQASITELPPPPTPASAPAKPRPKPRRATVIAPAPSPTPMGPPEPEGTGSAAESAAAPIAPTPDALAMGPEPAAEVVPADSAAPPPEPPPKELPRRVDLVYKAFLGTHGFLIGEAVYRFEHEANEYWISTVGEAKGIAALFVRGQGKAESHGYITASGLQPLEFSFERGSKDRRETATFDWEAGIVRLFEEKTAALELPTFDPLTLMWQAYFTPPVDDTQVVNVATTRRVGRYTLTRDGEEKVPWGEGTIDTERWRRVSDDGNTEALFWLAPTLRYIPVKIRVHATNRGTLEALLDSIRVDEPVAQQ